MLDASLAPVEGGPAEGDQRNFSRTGYIPSLGVDHTNPGTVPANILQSNLLTGEVRGFSGVVNPDDPAKRPECQLLPATAFVSVDHLPRAETLRFRRRNRGSSRAASSSNRPPGLSASVDYYDIELRNLVQLFDPTTIFDNAQLLPPSFIGRASPDAQFPDLPGRILQIVTFRRIWASFARRVWTPTLAPLTAIAVRREIDCQMADMLHITI